MMHQLTSPPTTATPAQFCLSPAFADATLVSSSGRRWPAHQAVLAAGCPLLKRTLLKTDDKEGLAVEPDEAAVVLLPDWSDEDVETWLTVLYGAAAVEVVMEERPGKKKKKKKGKAKAALAVGPAAYQPGRARHFQLDVRGRLLCPFADCRYARANRKSLNNHISVVHRKVQCPHCPRRMSRKNVASHVARMHVEKLLLEHKQGGVTAESVAKEECVDDVLPRVAVSEQEPAPTSLSFVLDTNGAFPTPIAYEHSATSNEKCVDVSVIPRVAASDQDPSLNSESFILSTYQSPYDGLYRCPAAKCSFSHAENDRLSEHIAAEHRRTSCPFCPYKVTRKFLPRHVASNHADLTGRLERVCGEHLAENCLCDSGPSQLHEQVREEILRLESEAAAQRLLTSEQPFQPDPLKEGHLLCPVHSCGHSSPSPARVKAHIAAAHTKVVCPHCGLTITKSSLAGHVARLHGKTLSCDECQEVFRTRTKLNAHLKADHGIVAERKRPARRPDEYTIPLDPDDPSQCVKCPYRQSKPSMLKKHYKEMHEKRQCPYCQREYSFYFIDRHIAERHTGEALRFQCETCSQRFFREIDLKHHTDQEHVRELKYVCEYCGKAFHSQLQLSRHRTKRHNTNRHFPCEPCEKVYLNKASLKKHVELHHQQLSKDMTSATVAAMASAGQYGQAVAELYEAQKEDFVLASLQ